MIWVWILAGVNQIFFRFMKWYLKALFAHDDISLYAVLEICCDMINQLIRHNINSKIKINVWIPSQHSGTDAQLPHFCPWNEIQEDEQGWKIVTSVFHVEVIWRKNEIYTNLEQMCQIVGLSSKIFIQHDYCTEQVKHEISFSKSWGRLTNPYLIQECFFQNCLPNDSTRNSLFPKECRK